MPPCDQRAGHPGLPLPKPYIVHKVVAIHESAFLEEELYGGLVPPLLGQATLGQDGFDQLVAAGQGLAPLIDVRRRDERRSEFAIV